MGENSRDGNFTAPSSLSLSTPDLSWLAIEQSGVLDNAPSLSKTPLTKLRLHQSEFGIKSDVTPTNLDTEDLQIVVSDGASIAVRVYRPHRKVGILPLCVVYHGGGWTIGDLDTEDGKSFPGNEINGQFSVVSSVPMGLPYSPENPFPVPLDDCFDAYKWAVANAHALGDSPQKVIVAGSSAGGNLAAAVALRARDNGLQDIVGQILVHPATCHPAFFPHGAFTLRSFAENENAPVLTQEDMQFFWDQYTPGDLGKHSYASPLLADRFDGLPPAFVQIAGLDPLRDEGLAYCKALQSVGVLVKRDVYAGIPHGFTLFPSLPACTVALRRAAEAISWILEASSG